MRLLTVAAMRRVDAAAIDGETSGLTLMEAAGAAVAARARARLPAGGRIVILCGPGNNGGDGFVAARLLAEGGATVELLLLGDRATLKGDAARAAEAWRGPVGRANPEALPPCDLVVDALFGAGLARDLDGVARALVEAVNTSGTPVLAVDVPSGVDGDTGAVRGAGIRAVETVTFVTLKPGHLLEPGRSLCGQLSVADIGTGPAAFEAGLAACVPTYRNGPDLWAREFPRLTGTSHKYTRGHALVLSGPATKTGAARLAARGALRVGAGLVTVVSPVAALPENAAHLTAIMLRPCESADDLDDMLTDERLNVVLAGPGLGTGEPTRERVAVAAAAGRGLVLDADALTSFAGQAPLLAAHLADGGAQAVLTPHAGEFARLFDGTEATAEGADKVARTRAAARLTGAVVVLKGSDTVIAAPDGRAAINDHGSPYLGTAGSGDVLGGLIAGLLAQGMEPFEAASAGVWLHGDAGLRHGPGLIAEDIPELMPAVLRGFA
ncbi:bifunctional ADP-dependent NAD(P)H-hydrate dehydratase/NAD(P)H-hydrate epimerase [Methylobacterium mesophilicum SR1.6/6]|uniref:Bifunctional NAD(P)H-hydrate repair enzyme n=1 Tax=Methylobacterium mesophilicum SR1.6/6 TaxID=908290 RepID=A0A6B9FYQ4_9HYPH|nr:bifunctional ADP-dependent NAD(P)H-hydrate dehydratase/NAD(P)H-hydrate epimerase [Methylobacterium mesophilicum]QGY05474.1 bifunctional ADP-dependent NAD(P)H-hydrate dehydratase/NAD(P)H-hydrate epimerase [Methylobacterium mesophilicum SR1.6/6]